MPITIKHDPQYDDIIFWEMTGDYTIEDIYTYNQQTREWALTKAGTPVFGIFNMNDTNLPSGNIIGLLRGNSIPWEDNFSGAVFVGGPNLFKALYNVASKLNTTTQDHFQHTETIDEALAIIEQWRSEKISG